MNRSEFLLTAYTTSAQAVADELDQWSPMETFGQSGYWFKVVNPFVKAACIAYDGSRYQNDDYERQVAGFDREVNVFYSGTDVLEIIFSESKRVWKRKAGRR